MRAELYAGLRDAERTAFLKSRYQCSESRISRVEMIKRAAEKAMGVDNAFRKLRRRDYVWARKLFIHEVISRGLCVSKNQLSREMGTNHATVLFHERTARDMIEIDKEFRSIYEQFKQLI